MALTAQGGSDANVPTEGEPLNWNASLGGNLGGVKLVVTQSTMATCGLSKELHRGGFDRAACDSLLRAI